jgi:cell division protein FtsX
MTGLYILLGVILLVVIIAILANLRDIRRYLRIRRM